MTTDQSVTTELTRSHPVVVAARLQRGHFLRLLRRTAKDRVHAKGLRDMITILIIVLLLILLGGGGGYYAHGRYGGAGLGGVLGLVLLVVLVLWLVGALGVGPVTHV